MKLYLAAGQYLGTQAEAKKLDRTYKPVDVPTSKDELIAFLNGPSPARPREAEPALRPQPAVQPERAAPAPSKIEAECRIEDAIAEADYPRALSLANHIHQRLMEHARATGGAA